MKKFWADWQSFWFAPQDLYNLSLFRFVLGLSMMGMYFIRFTQFKFYYFESGVLPVQFALHILPEGYATSFPFFLSTDAGIYAQGVFHLVLLTLFTIGVFGRSLTWLLFLVNLGLMQRNMSVVYGADLFANFWLFYLSLANHNQYFSIWNWLNKKRKRILQSDEFTSIALRLIQIQLCISYAYTGIEKLKGSQWWEGSAVWYVIGMDELLPHDFAFLKHFPVAVALLTMGTVIFEIYFIFAVWTKRLRYPWLMIGFLFHLSTAIFMDLWFFFLIVASAYIVYLPNLHPIIRRYYSAFRKSNY